MDNTNLRGMSKPDAEAYIAAHLTTLKLTEKDIETAKADEAKWASRVKLATDVGRSDLAATAGAERERAAQKKAALAAEAESLRAAIQSMREQLPVLGTYTRTVDPDLLEQSLLLQRGEGVYNDQSPTDEKSENASAEFAKLEKDASVDDALAALKAKMNKR
jgi:phage shock protein A